MCRFDKYKHIEIIWYRNFHYIYIQVKHLWFIHYKAILSLIDRNLLDKKSCICTLNICFLAFPSSHKFPPPSQLIGCGPSFPPPSIGLSLILNKSSFSLTFNVCFLASPSSSLVYAFSKFFPSFFESSQIFNRPTLPNNLILGLIYYLNIFFLPISSWLHLIK